MNGRKDGSHTRSESIGECGVLREAATGRRTSGKRIERAAGGRDKAPNNSLTIKQHWSSQEDSAPGHKAKFIQKWLEDNVPNFISAEKIVRLVKA
ncbi:hypothetical protein Trydic_g16984 [Trypoxylus dichotomus]